MHRIEEPQQGERVLSGAFWQLGFRPFYLVGATFASVSILLWVLQFTGIASITYLPGPLWHAHEMLFGFVLAIIVGFLFTAGSNWTGQPTPRGVLLAVMVLVWMLARVLSVTPYVTAAAIVDVAFPLLAAVGIGKPLLKSRNRRNYFFVVLLLVLAAIDVLFYLAQWGVVSISPRWAIQAGLDVVLVMLTVMGGRVIPMFTNNGVPGAGARRIEVLEKAVIGTTVAILVCDIAGIGSAWMAPLLAACGIAQAVRWSLWHPWTTTRTPIVWILHAGYVWIPIHLFLRALAEVGWVTSSSATHALAVGAAGGVILGMITRTARGHTGRLMKAGRSETVAYVLVVVAALVRVALPLISPGATVAAVTIAGVCWSAGFAIYAIRFWPVLTRKRVDGKPG
ncbi:NnrS family protein [Caenimonas koreensis]|uniref:NnrS family protein n=1 Tax=Caenimonas koreensis DSM 17982 TaxID=1121255 RepID=A0A844AX94_9BURK|nr:NnrS family protein [Caenimonas koreensis]MRD48995.1 NnrS family protein [Caenimonas koreensis DSM 17982]